jgi:acetyl esterase
MMLTLAALSEEGPEVGDVRDQLVPGPHGEFLVRVFTPEGTGPFPVYVTFHGGGWCMGNIAMTENECRDVVRDVGCVVVAVDYHLAPEHKFPIPVEDCYSATTWVVDHATDFGFDPERVAVGGSSSGGNLAAAVAIMAGDRGGPKLLFQVLDVPAVDSRMKTLSMEENAEGYLLTKESMQQFWSLYLRGPDDATNPYASPASAEDLSGLPPALILTAEYDPLRDEGEEYGRRLQAAAVPTTISRYDGMIHGFTFFTKILPPAKEARREMIAALRLAFTTSA